MGSKINPILYRLSLRKMWFSGWNVKNSDDFALLLKSDYSLRFYLTKIIKFFGFYKSNFFVWKSFSKFKIYSKLIENTNLSFHSTSDDRIWISKNKHFYNKKIYNLLFLTQFSNLFSFNLYKNLVMFIDRKSLFNKLKKNIKIEYIPFLSAQAFSDFVAYQISESFKRKEFGFKKNIRTGILRMAKIAFNKKTINFISGIKICCSGRWSKTVNSRKQSLNYTLGKINKQSMSSIIDYGFSIAKTNFGSCGIKILICFRSKSLRF